jgi:hypothetical protein
MCGFDYEHATYPKDIHICSGYTATFLCFLVKLPQMLTEFLL